MTGSRSRFPLLVVVATGLLMAGCTGIANLHIPTPPNTQAGEGATTTVTQALSGVSLAPVAPSPPTTVVLVGGQASLSGIVVGPSGAVPGATVYVERLVGDSVGAKAVPTAPDGTWKLPGILGGRYRIRAWHAPDLALTTPQILLLGLKDNPSVTLTLTAYNGQNLTAAVAPSPPLVGQVATLVLQATQQVVGNDGVVRGAPLPGASVLVFAAGNVVLAGTNPGITDATGHLTLQMGCATVGPVGLSATVNSLTSFPLTVADCSVFVPPVTTTTTVKPPSSSVP
jgi:hypothetical protein